MDLSPALQEIFPLTFSLISEAQSLSLRKEFSRDWGLDQIHFFPMLVRQRKFEVRVIEIADYEYLKHWLKDQILSRSLSAAPFVLNPTLQFIWLGEAAEILRKDPGLYALWKWDGQDLEKMLSPIEAQVLDRLREDQIFLQSEFSEDQNTILVQLISMHMVFENINQTELRS
jgi:hypothetical protein